jgi:hypothetical protein
MTLTRIAAVSLTLCCLAACGPEGSGPDEKRDSLTPGSKDPCASIDVSVCEATKGCELSADCPPCAPGQICPAMACQLVCRSVVVPPPPPPQTCSGLDEATCTATKGCQPLYGGVCPACAPGSTCPPCTTGYLGCTELIVDHCAGLSERACNRTSGCVGVYSACPDTAICACPAGVDCTQDPTIFTACQLDLGVCGGGVGGTTGGGSKP